MNEKIEPTKARLMTNQLSFFSYSSLLMAEKVVFVHCENNGRCALVHRYHYVTQQ